MDYPKQGLRLSTLRDGPSRRRAISMGPRWEPRAAWPRSTTRMLVAPSFGRAFFRMTDELMLFLALAGGFTVVLVEWWARQTP
jgi:hypothetical protein